MPNQESKNKGKVRWMSSNIRSMELQEQMKALQRASDAMLNRLSSSTKPPLQNGQPKVHESFEEEEDEGVLTDATEEEPVYKPSQYDAAKFPCTIPQFHYYNFLSRSSHGS